MKLNSAEHYHELADQAEQESQDTLAIAEMMAPDGTYTKGTEAYERLTEASVTLGMAIGLRFAASMEENDNGEAE